MKKRFFLAILIVILIISKINSSDITSTDSLIVVNKIKFEGLKVTKLKAILPGITLKSGDKWNALSKEKLKQELFDMGIFENINIQEIPDTSDDTKTNIVVKVKEKLPFIILPFGDYSSTRGFRIKTVFRYYNFAGFRKYFSAELEFVQTSRLNLSLIYQDPILFNNKRLSFSVNWSLYSSVISYYVKVNSIRWNKDFDFGTSLTSSLGYTIPIIEAPITPEIGLEYTSKLFTAEPTDDLTVVGSNNSLQLYLGISFGKSFVKEGVYTPTGNKFNLNMKFYLPTMIGDQNKDFRFRFEFTDIFYKTFSRKHFFKMKWKIFTDYNFYENIGDIRGAGTGEFSGWAALTANFEYFLPVFNLNLDKGLSLDIDRDLLFQFYWVFFADLGIALKNDYNDYTLDWNYLHLLPGMSVGTGLRIYPKFMNLILRFDLGVNVYKLILNKFKGFGSSLGIYLTFSEFF